MKCTAVFTTIESAELSQLLLVQNMTAVEPFSRDKLLISVYGSLKHRKTATQDAGALVDTIIQRISPEHSNGSIQSSAITAITLNVLGRFDKVAATHYQAFHSMYSEI